ncbi:MAG: hypothetical protein B6D45_07280 [Ignavibacteriales bacterium UTCHB3]|nr:MAG: hypothetical protein B6D45_07280 [Ignavibacteriales bacterium UTCHB3]
MLMNDMLSKLAADSKFVGTFIIVMGALYCLSIFGAIVGIPAIFVGLRARDGGNNLERFIATDDPNDKIMAYQSYQKHFFILKVLLIIAVVFLVISVLFYSSVFFSFLSLLGRH